MKNTWHKNYCLLPTPTNSNHSSTSGGAYDHNTCISTFIERARALVDSISSPYHRDDFAYKNIETRFCRDSRRCKSSFAARLRYLHGFAKKKFLKLRHSRGVPPEEVKECKETSDVVIQPRSFEESIPNGSGSRLLFPSPTRGNHSFTSGGEDDHNTYVGTFIGRARALVNCTPSPYDQDGLAFKKGDIIDIIAKHETGIWVGWTQGKVGHFKFIYVEEIEEKKTKHRHVKENNDLLNLSKNPETLEELLKEIGLEEYANVLVLHGYDKLDTFKEIEKIDLDNLRIINIEHSSKLLRAAEILQDVKIVEELEDSNFKQSPRDPCFASHENLIHQDFSLRVLNNGQFTVNMNDQDTYIYHSESRIHPIEGQDTSPKSRFKW